MSLHAVGSSWLKILLWKNFVGIEITLVKFLLVVKLYYGNFLWAVQILAICTQNNIAINNLTSILVFKASNSSIVLLSGSSLMRGSLIELSFLDLLKGDLEEVLAGEEVADEALMYMAAGFTMSMPGGRRGEVGLFEVSLSL